MAYDIGPRIKVTGEKEFNSSFDRINNNIKELGSGMKALTSTFGKNGASQDQLRQKGKLLTSQIDTQKSKLSILSEQYNKQKIHLGTLRTALEKATQEYGENSAEASKAKTAYEKQEAVLSKLKTGINETTTYINKLGMEFSENEAEIRKLNASLESAETEISQAGGAASAAAGKFEHFKKKLEGINQKAGKVSSAFSPLTKAIGGAATATFASVPATTELNRDLSFLKSNATKAGISIENTEKAFDTFNTVTGESDSSVEAISNLLESGFDNNNLQLAVEGVAGAMTKLPDTFKIESIADGIQETLATGKPIGQFAEMLDRFGISTEDFEMQLAGCNTEIEKQNLVLGVLSKVGGKSALDSWKKQNPELAKYNSAVSDFQVTMAKFALQIMPLLTPVINAISKLLGTFNKMPKAGQIAVGAFAGILAAISPVAKVIGLFTKNAAGLSKISTVIKGIGTAFKFLTGPVGIILMIVTTLIVLYNKCEWFRTAVNAIWKNVKDFFVSTWQIIVNFFTVTIPGAWDKVATVFKSIPGWWNGLWTGIRTKVVGIWTSIKTTVLSHAKSIKTGAISAFNTLRTGIMNAVRNVFDIIKRPFVSAKNFIVNLARDAFSWGADFINGLKDGIVSGVMTIVNKIRELAGNIRSLLHFSRPDEGPLRDYETWMPDFVKGMAKGIDQEAPALLRKIQNMAAGMAEAANITGNLAMEGYAGSQTVIHTHLYLGNKDLSTLLTKDIVKNISTEQKFTKRGKGYV